ncbi:MAG: ComEC/Rec2 family competence protein [Clostridia bacterium]|nr:ComEC/Rec2 family competence protein [Clostridia bacterium]
MQLIRDNPVTSMFFAFFLSSCVFAYMPVWMRLLFTGSAALLLVFLLFRRTSDRFLRHSLLLICAACITAGLLSSASHLHAQKLDSLSGTEDTAVLRITECEYRLSYAAGYIAEVVESDILPKHTKIRLYSDQTSLAEGDIADGTIVLRSLSEDGSSFDGRAYYLPKRIMLQAEDTGLVHRGSEPYFSLTSLFRQIRERFSAMILAHTSYEAGGLSSAVLLGDRDSLDEAMERDFRRLGISHLLVVSGTHFSVLVTLAGTGLKRFRIPPKARAFISMGIILFIMLLTGLTPSVVRAGIMHLMAQVSLLLMRKTNIVHSFAFSGALMVLVNPYAAMDCGLQLSFAATYCCILFQLGKGSLYRTVRRKTGMNLSKLPLISALETVFCTCLVSLSTLPLIWLYFGEVSLFSIPANVIFTPLISLLMLLTGVYLILYPLRLFVLPLAALLNLFCGLLGNMAEFLSKPDWVMIPVNYGFSVFFLIPLSALLLLLPFASKTGKIRMVLSSAVLCVLFFTVVGVIGIADRANVYFSYLPENKNDGFVLKSDGKILLCEVSDASFGYSYNLTDEMSRLHACEIETLLLTHYHNKHIQLVNRLSEREILRSLVLPEPIDDRERGIYDALTENAQLHGIPVTTVEPGGSFQFCGTEITLFERTYLSRSTHPVTALSVDMGAEKITMVSCSFNQSVPEITDALEESEYVIFGGHSPVYKKTFDLSFAKKPKAVTACEDALGHMEENLRELVQDLTVDAPLRLKVRRNG